MSHRNCTAFEDRLRETVEDRTVLRSPDLRAAAAHCPDCQAAWDRHARLDRAIAAWAHRVPQVDLTDAVLARFAFEEAYAALHTPPTTTVPRPVRGGWIAVAAAAVVLLMLGPALFGPSAHVPDGGPVAQRGPGPAVSGPIISPAAELDVLVRDAESACLVLADEATGAMMVLDALVPSVAARQTAAPPTDASPSWVEEIGHDLQPIGRDVSRAVGFLWDAVPRHDVDAT